MILVMILVMNIYIFFKTLTEKIKLNNKEISDCVFKKFKILFIEEKKLQFKTV